ncbi:MAG TPA: alpha-2-macroglobulin, partial [Chitinophagaceae bacterium]|nr:alpha-2-macroglobulin [Chitinophagaceae bacterium]
MKLLKTIVIFAALFSQFTMNAQSQPVKNYESAWKRVEDFVKKNLPRSASAEVKKIYELAKKENQDAQVIKSLVYLSFLQSENREDNQAASISEFEKELALSKEPVRSILKSLLAEMYWNYYQQNRWGLYNRTKTTSFKKEDMATWGADDFHQKVGALYLSSLQAEVTLQKTRLEPFDAIIVKGNMRHLRPTLFDLLAHRALQYFENDERDISKPAYAFEIDQASAFDPAADFVHRIFPNRDSSSLQYQALLVYQKLISFHLNDPRPDALIDADLKRLEFVRQKSVHPDKDQLYYNSINHVAHQYNELPAAAQAWYLVAEYYNRQADEYKPYEDTTHRYKRLKAKEIC